MINALNILRRLAVVLVGLSVTVCSAQTDYTLTESLPLEPVVTAGLTRIDVHPKRFRLDGSRQRLQLVVTGYDRSGAPSELTRVAQFTPSNKKIVTVSDTGKVSPLANGKVDVTVLVAGQRVTSSIEVLGQEAVEPVSFMHHTLPVLSKANCSSGSCHGSPHGKAGFRLSLRASDPALDERTLVREEFGRRTNPLDPDSSLVLLKPTAQIAHEGGKRLNVDDDHYRLLRDWIAEGCTTNEEEPACVDLQLYPASARVLTFPVHTQQIRVDALFADGSRRDVTDLAVFESSDPGVARVLPSGLAVGQKRGEAAIVVRYLKYIKSLPIMFIRDVPGFVWNDPPRANYVDRKVYEKLRKLQYSPAPLCSDQEFVRRVFLDVTGLLPSAERTTAFLNDPAPDRRSRLIDELLEGQEHARFWAQKWGDLLRVSRKQIGSIGVRKLNRWLEHSIAVNQPYDKFVETLLTATGSSHLSPAVNYYRAAADPLDSMETTAQLFLATRIQCAKCHNHPYERWTQDEYFGLASVFARVKRVKGRRGGEMLVYTTAAGEVTHPVSGREMTPWVPSTGLLPVDEGEDRRGAFVEWLTSTDNPFFARVEVNRIWGQVMGRGIVEPFDDFRDSNPPSNGPLLDALAVDFAQSGFDRRHILRTILNSRTYQASSQTDAFNVDDTKYFSHYASRRLTAEQLVDALGHVTGKPRHFFGVPENTPATQLPAPDLQPHDRNKIGNVDFLKVFGQPERQSVCSCDRSSDMSLGQALQLWNGELIHQMLTDPANGLHQWIKDGVANEEIIRRLYQRGLCRPPTAKELQVNLDYIKSRGDSESSAAVEDICWALVNRNEFLFQH